VWRVISNAESAAPRERVRPQKKRRVPGQVLTCGWCDRQLTLATVGRTPRWCSASCRHRAWETSRAAARGAVAVRVVDRAIEVEVPVPVVQRIEVPHTPKGSGWADSLAELGRQLDTGRVYDRDLPAIVGSVEVLLAALTRRHRRGGRR